MDPTTTASSVASSISQDRRVVKEEPADDYDGSYMCLVCSESVRGTDALGCSKCQSNPFHRSCMTNELWLEQCPSCKQRTVTVWSGKSAASSVPIATIDLTARDEAERDQAKRKMVAEDAAEGGSGVRESVEKAGCEYRRTPCKGEARKDGRTSHLPVQAQTKQGQGVRWAGCGRACGAK